MLNKTCKYHKRVFDMDLFLFRNLWKKCWMLTSGLIFFNYCGCLLRFRLALLSGPNQVLFLIHPWWTDMLSFQQLLQCVGLEQFLGFHSFFLHSQSRWGYRAMIQQLCGGTAVVDGNCWWMLLLHGWCRRRVKMKTYGRQQRAVRDDSIQMTLHVFNFTKTCSTIWV